ncbi:MAG: hypothetical protein GC159_15485 [Phycisphaera sp.]|nr:hypothetical protein [Phycisphaera sp.]
MLNDALELVSEVLQRGGWVMWPLGVLSVVAVTLIFERCWFWLRTNSPGRVERYRVIGQSMRSGQAGHVLKMIEGDDSVYGQLVRRLLSEDPTDAAAVDAVESQRPRLARFMTTLGTIITAAPMLGILGTVTGIISAFKVLGDQTVTDPAQVGSGIAEALLTTVVGLVIALVVLFPYNAFRAQMERTLGRMEALIAAAQSQNDKQ